MREPVGNTGLSQFDVLVVGSGAGGAAATHVLCAAGLKVLVLEAGSNYFLGLDDATKAPVTRFSNDELKSHIRGFGFAHPITDPRTFRTRESDGDRIFVGDVNGLPKTVGGGTVYADLKMPRFTVDDFHLGTLQGGIAGATFADWPVDYDQLEPFYEHAELVTGVQGAREANPFESPRRSDFPMPPGAPMYVGLKMSEALESLGYTGFPYPASVNSRPRDGRPPCVDCGFCSGFGCPSNAKGSAAVTTLRRALLTGNCLLLPETRASRLLMNDSGTEVSGLEARGPSGEVLTFRADRYVLAASPIEDVRLLLLSANGGVGNSSGRVGRNLMFHCQTVAAGFFEERVHSLRGKSVSHGFADFRGRPNDPEHPMGGIVEISGSAIPISEALNIRRIAQPLSLSGATVRKLLRQGPFRDRLVSLVMQAEDAPQDSNRVDLDPQVKDLDGLPVPRITYQSHAYELSAREFYSPKLMEILGKAGAKYALISPKDDVPASKHILGTLRFGTDPATSVCQPSGRFHDVGNLYAADGALFPTSSGYNPTLTITALAMHVGASMVNPASPEQALPRLG